MDILDKLRAKASDIATPIPQNVNLYFDTLRTPEENEEFQKKIAEAAQREAEKAAEKYLENLKDSNKIKDENNNAVLIPNRSGIPFVDLIF